MDKKIHSYFLLSVVLLLSAEESFAYVDPGTGSILLQIIFAIFASSYLWSRKAIDFMRKLFRKRS